MGSGKEIVWLWVLESIHPKKVKQLLADNHKTSNRKSIIVDSNIGRPKFREYKLTFWAFLTKTSVLCRFFGVFQGKQTPLPSTKKNLPSGSKKLFCWAKWPIRSVYSNFFYFFVKPISKASAFFSSREDMDHTNIQFFSLSF